MTLEELIRKDTLFVLPHWRFDYFRRQCFRAARKGYFKYSGTKGRQGYGDYFERTNKEYVEGDSFKKPITYSLGEN